MTSATLTAPVRSLEQRRSALDRANAIRLARAQLKRDLRSCRVWVVDVILADPMPECLCSMKVLDLLMACPRVGQVKALKVLNRCRISPVKTLAGMTRRQRGELAMVLRAW